MDAFTAVAAKREIRDYDGRPLPEEVVGRILQAARVSGSGMNRQRWRFFVLDRRELLDRAAQGVTRPTNFDDAALGVAITISEGTSLFDAGRAAQSMMLAALNDGVGSCPNTTKDVELFRELLGFGDDEQLVTLITFGYPRRPIPDRPAEEWIARADRKPLDEVVVRL